MADSLPMDVLKERQEGVAVEIADSKRLLEHAQTHSEEMFARLEQVVDLLEHAEQLYATVGDEGRQILNDAVFEQFKVDLEPDEGFLPS